jgi:hypothetical protein
MSILGGILEGIAAVAAVVLSGGSALGIVAGVMLGMGALTQMGVIGGSVGKFMESGWGEGLTAAVSLGSAAYGMIGSSALGAQIGQEEASSLADVDTAAQNTMAATSVDIATQGSMAATSSAISSDAGISMSDVGALQDPATMAETAGLNPEDAAAIQQSSNAVNAASDQAAGAAGASGTGGAAGTASATSQETLANTSQVTANQTTSLMNQTGANTGINTSSTLPSANDIGNTGGAQVASGAQTQGVGPQYAGASATNPDAVPMASSANAPMSTGAYNTPTGGPPINSPVDANGMASAPAGSGNAVPGAGPGTPSDPGVGSTPGPATGGSGAPGGILNGIKNFATANPRITAAGVQGGLGLLSGAANSISQQKQIEQMIQAQEMGNLSYQNQSQVGQLQAAAAAPITVPQGFMQRAQATKNLMGGNTGGVTPNAAGVPAISISPPPTPGGVVAPTMMNPQGGLT